MAVMKCLIPLLAFLYLVCYTQASDVPSYDYFNVKALTDNDVRKMTGERIPHESGTQEENKEMATCVKDCLKHEDCHRAIFSEVDRDKKHCDPENDSTCHPHWSNGYCYLLKEGDEGIDGDFEDKLQGTWKHYLLLKLTQELAKGTTTVAPPEELANQKTGNQ